MSDEGKLALFQICANRNVKVRAKARSIFEVIDNAAEYLTTKEIYRRASLVDPSVTMSTTMRTMRDLTDAGLLRKLSLATDAPRYMRADSHGCKYLIDAETGEVSKLDNGPLDAAVREVIARMGFEPDGYYLEVVGKLAGKRKSRYARSSF